jgi:hypothetical protein
MARRSSIGSAGGTASGRSGGRVGRTGGHKLEFPRLPEERYIALRAECEGLSDDDVRHSPSRLQERVAWATAILAAAQRASAELLRVPMDPEADLTDQELTGLAERIDFLRQLDGELRTVRQNPHSPQLLERMSEARQLEAAVVHGLEHLFRKDPKVLRQVRDIRQGDGLADLMQDASHLWALWQQHKALCKRLCRGESQKLIQLVEMTNELSQLQSTLPQARELRQQRDRAYTLVMITIERIREAATYYFFDQPERRAEFAPFSPLSRKGRKDSRKAPA